MLTNEDYMKLFHETKNSVSLISSYLQLLEKKYPQISSYDYWFDTTTEVSHLKSLLSELSQVKFGENLQLCYTDMRLFLSELFNHDRTLTGSNEVSFSFDFGTYPLWTLIDPLQFRHAINNIIKNAYESMENEGQISICTYLRKDKVQIDISDSGKGLPPEMMDNIFKPFVTNKQNGTGLGLTITKQVIEAHNGDISCSSKSSTGCTFHILLPYKSNGGGSL